MSSFDMRKKRDQAIGKCWLGYTFVASYTVREVRMDLETTKFIFTSLNQLFLAVGAWFIA